MVPLFSAHVASHKLKIAPSLKTIANKNYVRHSKFFSIRLLKTAKTILLDKSFKSNWVFQ